MCKKFPFSNDAVVNANVADVSQRQSVKFSQLLYFVKKFPILLGVENSSESISGAVDKLELQFNLYQVECLPESVCTEPRADVQWSCIGKISDAAGRKKNLIC